MLTLSKLAKSGENGLESLLELINYLPDLTSTIALPSSRF